MPRIELVLPPATGGGGVSDHALLTNVTGDQHHPRNHNHGAAADGTDLVPVSVVFEPVGPSGCLYSRRVGDGDWRFKLQETGGMTWGDGASAGDASLYRVGLSTLRMGAALQVDGALTAGGLAVVVTTDARLADARTPTAHAATHNAGGADALAVDALAATGSLRTLGAGATQAVSGTDARLSDSRAPSGAAGGELAGTYPNPTITATHAGGTHHTQAHNHGAAADGVGLLPETVGLRNAATTATVVLSTQTAASATQYFYLKANGDMSWGDGAAAHDVVLYRSAANILSIATGDSYGVNGVAVVGARKTGWAAATGTATRTTFATTTVTLPLLAQRVKALIDDLISHGLIGA